MEEITNAICELSEIIENNNGIVSLLISNFFAIGGAVLTTYLTFILNEKLLVPKRELKEVKNKINIDLNYNCNYIVSPIHLEKAAKNEIDNYNQISNELRRDAFELKNKIYSIKMNKKQEEIYIEIYEKLIGLSNSLSHPYKDNDPLLSESNRNTINEINMLLLLKKNVR